MPDNTPVAVDFKIILDMKFAFRILLWEVLYIENKQGVL